MLLAAMCLPPTAFAEDASPPGADIGSVRAWLLDHNPELRALQAEAEAAEARVQPAGALPDPMFGLRLEGIDADRPNLLPGNVGMTQYSVRQAIPLWGKRDLARDIASQEAIALHEERSATVLERLAETEQAYVRYWHADASLQVVDRLIDLIHSIEAVARERYALGLAPQQDAIRAQVAGTRLRAERIERAAVRDESAAQLNTGMGRPVDAALTAPISEPAIDLPVDARERGLTAIRGQSHPMLRAQTAMANAADDAFDLQKRRRLPDLNVGVGLMQQGNRLESYELMFEVEIPFQRRALHEREREASLRRDAAQARVEHALSLLEARFGEAWARWVSARDRQRLYRDTLLPQTEANFASALASYRVGDVDFATLLESLEAWQGADLSRLDARRDELQGAAELRALIGSTP
ncbi:MAG: TolC family protein [Xanthomonadales bacterium]|nr:TolC family protein [Xanthomonadales bacterium]